MNRPLFERSRHGVVLTAAGRTFERHAIAALQVLAQGRQEAMLDARFRGTVSLGLQFYLWESLAESWIDLMTEVAPDLALRIEPGFSDEIMTLLISGLLDVGILFEPRLSSGIKVEHLTDEPLVLVCTDANVNEHSWYDDYVAVYWGQEFQDAFARVFPVQPQPRLTVGLSSLGLTHILTHGGSAYLLERTVKKYIQQKKLFPVPDAPRLPRPVFLAYREALAGTDDLEIAIGSARKVITS